MGRPLNKKYFGNTNTSGVGGKKIATVVISGTKTGYTSTPVLTASAPELDVGVLPVLTPQMIIGEIVNITHNSILHSYTPGTTLQLKGGYGKRGKLLITSTEVRNVSIVSAGEGYTAGNTVEIAGGTGTASTVTVVAVDGTGAATEIDVATAGNYTVNPPTESAATNAIAPSTGTGLVINPVMGIRSASIQDPGLYNKIPAAPDNVVHDGPGNATFELSFNFEDVLVTNPGGGYDAVPTVTCVPDRGTVFTATLRPSKFNAIAISANVTGAGAKEGDIIRQVSSRRYQVVTADGVGICRLVATAPGAGEMTLTAKDSANGTYYVTKLVGRTAVIVKGNRTGTQFVTGDSGIVVPWVFSPATATVNKTVEIVHV